MSFTKTGILGGEKVRGSSDSEVWFEQVVLVEPVNVAGGSQSLGYWIRESGPWEHNLMGNCQSGDHHRIRNQTLSPPIE